MKHLFTTLFVAAALSSVCSAAPKVNVLVELNGMHNGLLLTEAGGEGFTYSNPQSKDPKIKFAHYATSSVPVSADWKEYTVTFIPNTPSCTFGVRSTSASAGHWIDIDDIKVVNGTIKNPSFEMVNSKQEAAFWRYYSLDCLRVNKKDAAEGKNYATVNSRFAMRINLSFKKGEKITVSFKARLGQPVKVPAKPFFSSMAAK
jgi:hypothetical protein